MAETRKRKNEDIEKVLRRFKRQVKNEHIIDYVRDREYYEKPSENKKKRHAAARRRTLAQQRENEL